MLLVVLRQFMTSRAISELEAMAETTSERQSRAISSLTGENLELRNPRGNGPHRLGVWRVDEWPSILSGLFMVKALRKCLGTWTLSSNPEGFYLRHSCESKGHSIPKPEIGPHSALSLCEDCM